MDMLQNYEEIPIAMDRVAKFSGLAYDGCSFYLTLPCSYEICEYDKTLCFKKCYKAFRRYTCICYDSSEKCFWAAAQNYYCILFKLNCFMQELDCIRIQPCKDCGCIITGIAHDCKDDKLLVSFTNCIMLCEKPKCEDISTLKQSTSLCFTQAFSIAPFYGFTYLKDTKQYISIMDDEWNDVFSAQIPNYWVIKGVTIFNDSLETADKVYLYILVLKNSFSPCIICKEIVNSEIKDKLCLCNYITNGCDSVPERLPNEDSLSLILESVALVESAIANVLNSEGDKLQKMLNSTDDIEKMLETSKCINNTITNVTHLEHVLYNRLCSLCDKYSTQEILPQAEE